jgi:hypothetical protein
MIRIQTNMTAPLANAVLAGKVCAVIVPLAEGQSIPQAGDAIGLYRDGRKLASGRCTSIASFTFSRKDQNNIYFMPITATVRDIRLGGYPLTQGLLHQIALHCGLDHAAGLERHLAHLTPARHFSGHLIRWKSQRAQALEAVA